MACHLSCKCWTNTAFEKKLHIKRDTYPKLSTLKTEQNNFMFNWNFFNSNNALNRISLSLKQSLKDVNPKTAIERFSGN